MTLSDFQFDLPPELIAQVPAERRDQARLLVLDRQTGELTDTHVHALADHLRPGDLLVVNDTRVIPARLFGRTVSGGAVELLLIRPLSVGPAVPAKPSALSQGTVDFLRDSPLRRGSGQASRRRQKRAAPQGERKNALHFESNESCTVRAEALEARSSHLSTVSQGEGEKESWLCLGKPAKRLRAGTPISFPENVRATVETVHGNGHYTMAFEDAGTVQALITRHGEIPLPPYIRRPDGPLPLDQTRYQTIFASVSGAIAAPTAGLHFTDELLDTLQHRGVEVARLTLHVGPGTFLPVRSEHFDEHVMEPEWCDVPAATATRIREVKATGGRIVAVGTTTTRALESAASKLEIVTSGSRWADRFIVPGDTFRVVDALFTNFHLPGSTLLLLVSAFADRERILTAYAEAVRRGYRFYSYGDAMLIQ